MNVDPVLGIDLGTTHSLGAVWREGKAQIIPNSLGTALTPSVVGLSDTGAVLVGEAARDRLITHPESTASLFKRRMGTDWAFEAGKQSYRAEELSALVLRSLREDAQAQLGCEVSKAIISVPAYFNDTQRKATRLAGRLAGLDVLRLINEPTAAALAYGLQLGQGESRFVVLDLGGGTFDVSVLHQFEGVMEVRACAGDNYLGGEDFLDALQRAFQERHAGELHFDSEAESRAFLQRLRRQAELAKRDLSQATATVMALQLRGKRLDLHVTRADFELLSQPLLARLRAPIERALRESRLDPASIDQVILAGGASRMPMFKDLVARITGQEPAAHLDCDQVIALGAAVQAGLSSRDKALEDMVMTDVCPYSLGVAIVGTPSRSFKDQGDRFLPVIERNMPVPYSRVERVYSVNPGQTQVDLKVYQGESRYVKDNIYLGSLEVPLAGIGQGQEVDVRLTYELSGLLEVEATVVATGVSKSLILQQTPGQMTEEEIATRLSRLTTLKLHPRAQAPNAALMARGARVFEEHLGEVRARLEPLLRSFEEAMEAQRPDDIRSAAAALKNFLDQVESSHGL